MKQIEEFSFHKEMSKKGQKHAVEKHDLAMLNKIWSSPVLCSKSPHVRAYLEVMRIEERLTFAQFYFIEKHARSVNFPFSKKKSVYQNQIMKLLTEKEPREQILFKEVEMISIQGQTPPAA